MIPSAEVTSARDRSFAAQTRAKAMGMDTRATGNWNRAVSLLERGNLAFERSYYVDAKRHYKVMTAALLRVCRGLTANSLLPLSTRS